MPNEIDLAGEFEPTDQMVELQAQAQERADRAQDDERTDHDGSIATKPFDVTEALSDL